MACKVVFRSLSLIRKNIADKGKTSGLKKNLHLSGSIFLAALAATAAIFRASESRAELVRAMPSAAENQRS
jgi:hypothetical protein